MFESNLGHPVRNDLHGIDVYEHRDDLIFVGINAQATIGKSAATFVDQIAATFHDPVTLTEKQVLAAELYCASFFDVSFRSRLITLVTAVEALLEPPPRSENAQALVSAMKAMVRCGNIDEDDREAMLSSLHT